MKKWILFLLVFSLVESLSVWADSDNSSALNPNTGNPVKGRRSGGKKLRPPAQDDPSILHGECTVVVNAANPMPGTCVNVLLILNDKNGNEVIRTRTNQKGIFDFITEPGKLYQIVSGSKYYTVADPTSLVKGGSHIELSLQQK